MALAKGTALRYSGGGAKVSVELVASRSLFTKKK